MISKWLDRLAEQIDLFLVGKKVTDKKNDSNIRLQNSTFTTEGKQVVNNFTLSVNPRFPNLEEFLQLKFTSTDDRADTRKAFSNSQTQNQTEKNYAASASLFKKLGQVQTSFQPRIALENPIKLSHSLNFETAAYYKFMIFNPKFELFADADKGVGFYNAFNFQFSLSPIWSLTLINDAEYVEKTHTYTVNNGFAFGQVISDRINFGYSLIFTSNNRPSYHLENYVVAFAWNQQIYKKILDIQFIPQLDFQKEMGFKGATGLTFNVTLSY